MVKQIVENLKIVSAASVEEKKKRQTPKLEIPKKEGNEDFGDEMMRQTFDQI